MQQPKFNSIPVSIKWMENYQFQPSFKTSEPEKVEALNLLEIKSGKCNGTPKKRGVETGHFPSHFYYITHYKFSCEVVKSFKQFIQKGES